MKGKDLCLGFPGDASRPKVKAASCNFKQRHCPSQKIIRKQSNNCGPTLSKVIHAKKLEKKLRSENLIMGKLREGCSWCERQGKVHLTQNFLREPLSHFHSVTSVVTFFHKSSVMNHKKWSHSESLTKWAEKMHHTQIGENKPNRVVGKSYEWLNIHIWPQFNLKFSD